MTKCFVIGNSTIDKTFLTNESLKFGESILSFSTKESIGGKGVNQAVAIARCGIEVDFISSIGTDHQGQTIENVDEESVVNLELEAGEAALFDYRLAHASNPNQSDDRRIGLGLRFIPPTASQVRVDWDSATLVRGEDRYGNFELEPEPRCDLDPIAVSFHEKADATQRKIFYAGAKPPRQAAE